MSLVPRSEAERQRKFREASTKLRSSPSEVMCSVSNVLTIYIKDPKSSLHCASSTVPANSQKNNIYAQLPDLTASDPNLINKINRAGKLFIEQNECPPLNFYKRKITQQLQTVEDIEKFANGIMAALRVINVAVVGGPTVALCTNEIDIKEVLITCCTTILSSCAMSDEIQQQWCSPLVTPGNAVAWLKFEFTSEMNVSQFCGLKAKEQKIEIKYYAFYFPTVNDFDHAVKYAEKHK
jgi:hypothetical protein